MLAFLSFSYFFDPSPVVPPQAVNSAAFSPDDQLQLGDCGFNGHNNGYTSSMWMDIYILYIYICRVYRHYIYIPLCIRVCVYIYIVIDINNADMDQQWEYTRSILGYPHSR